MSPNSTETVLDVMTLIEDLTAHLLHEPHFPPPQTLDRNTVGQWIQAVDTRLPASIINFLSMPVLDALLSSSSAPSTTHQSPPFQTNPTTHPWLPSTSTPNPPSAPGSNPPRTPSPTPSLLTTPTKNKYCICGNIQHGPMIACDNHCARKWFHFRCVGLVESPPRGTRWFCPQCRGRMGVGALTNGLVRGA